MAVALYVQQLNSFKYLDVFLIIFRTRVEAMNYRVPHRMCLLPVIHFTALSLDACDAKDITVSWFRDLQRCLSGSPSGAGVSGFGQGWTFSHQHRSHPQCHQSSASIQRPRRKSLEWRPACDAMLRAFPCPESFG